MITLSAAGVFALGVLTGFLGGIVILAILAIGANKTKK